MDAAAFNVSAVVCAVMSALLAVAIPVMVLRRATRARELRDRFLYARPGSVVAVCVTLMVVFVGLGLLLAALSLRYVFAWATVALAASAVLTVAIYLTRYVRFVRAERDRIAEQHLAADGGNPSATD